MPIGAIFTWIVDHIGLGSIKNLTGIRKDLVDTKKAKLETQKLAKELEPPLIKPATFDDVKNYDPKYNRIRATITITSISLFILIMLRISIWPIIREAVLEKINTLLGGPQ